MRENRRVLFFLFCLSLMVHIVLLNDYHRTPFFQSPVIDAQEYDGQAVQIAQGSPKAQQEFYEAPLYPYFLALIYSVAGHSYWVARGFQAFLGSLDPCLIFLLGTIVFDRRIGLIAGLASAFYAPLAFYDIDLLNPGLAVLISLLILIIVQRANANALVCFGIGLLLGLLCLDRAEMLLFAALMCATLSYSTIGTKTKGARTIGLMVSMAAGIVLAIAPATIHNYNALGRFVPICTSGGLNFYLGNNHDSAVTSTISPGPEWQDLIHLPTRSGDFSIDPAENDAFWYRYTLQDISLHPRAFLDAILRKTAQFICGYETMRNQSIYDFRRWSMLLRMLVWDCGIAFPWGVVFPLAVCGMIAAVRHWRRLLHLYLLVFTVFATNVLIFVSDRYRLPAVPVLLIFAGYGAVMIGEFIKKRRHAPALGYGALCIGFLFLCNYPIIPRPALDESAYYTCEGNAYFNESRFADATVCLTKALHLNPNNPMALYYIASVDRKLGLVQESLRYYLAAQRIGPRWLPPIRALISIYVQKGRLDLAAQQVQAALAVDPNDARMQNELQAIVAAESANSGVQASH